MNEQEKTVKVEGLRKTFGEFTAVDNISFEVQKGEIFGFLGPNGAGKSTTIKMLCGLLRPDGGKGSVGGFDIMKESEKIKKHIGYMSQKFSLYDDLTVRENIAFFGGIYGVSGKRFEKRCKWVLNMAALGDRKNDITGTLAGGVKQRLALGCAMLHEPPILFLDEPTSGVDPISRRNFWSLIYGLSREGTTVFITTHYMDEAEYCGRLALIYRGEIIAAGTSHEMKTNYMKREILEIETDNVVGAIEVLYENSIETAIFGSLLHATVDNAEEAAPEVKALLESSGIAVIKIEKIIPSLEDVFVNLIDIS